jgi:hypothetical protein
MMRTLLLGFRYLVANDWAWVFAKITSGIFLPLALLENISSSSSIQNGVISEMVYTSLMCLMIFGGSLSIIGILARATRVRPLIVGYAIEMGGLIPLAIAPLFLSIIFLAGSIKSGGGLSGFALCLSLAALFAARFTDIYTHHLSSKKEHETRLAKAHRRLRGKA